MRPMLLLLGLTCLASLAASTARATPVAFARGEFGVDWTSAGVGAIGSDDASITISGVTGTVKRAYLYWHGVDGLDAGGDGIYDNESISFNGNAVTGVSLGDAPTNCWGDGASRAFRADVTPFVTGDGAYTVSGLASKPGHDANGASLVVIFDDGNRANNRDLIFFEGNDSNNPEQFPGEDDGWHALLATITYNGGTVHAQLHVADGQDFEDSDLTFMSGSGSLTVPDDETHWDGTTVPLGAGNRSPNGSLWDIHDFDVTSLFGAPGTYALNLDGQDPVDDCLGLVLVLIDLPAGAGPLCGRVPSTTCRAPGRGKARLAAKNKSPDTKDVLEWRWGKGDASAKTDFGDPLTDTRYALCVYDQGGEHLVTHLEVPGGVTCGGKPCWKASKKGFNYRDKNGALDEVALVSGEAGKAKVNAKGKGAELGFGAFPLTLPIVVQLQASNNECWSATYSKAKKNTSTLVNANSD
ncbi:MAG TPA: hypothetical protein VMS22_04575 [Candidatus Eisenbacteria bacterium]|nr:hypothetical protein [Candidatus Eisenbacteria bacterium]